MSIQKISQNYTTRILKNKTLLKGLEKISDHGTTFTASTSLLMSLTVRPLAIFSTPDTEKENKQYAAANSICSGLIKFGMVEAIALPIETAVKKINQNPKRFLNSKTIHNLSNNTEGLAKSRSYNLITQIIKLSAGFITAIPKSILTIALIPVLMDKMFFRNKKSSGENIQNQQQAASNKQNSINFTGTMSNKIAKGISKIVNNEKIQNFAKKYETKDKDIAKHITAGTDILLTSSFAYQTSKSKDIKENRKKALIYNNLIATGITIIGGYGIDNIIKNKTGKFIDKFKQIHATDPKLNKYIEGINILRPAIIFAAVYYGILPIFSTYMAEKIDKFVEKQNNKNKLTN